MNFIKPRNHIAWVVIITCLMLLLEYGFDGQLSKGTFVKSFLFALFLEFAHFCTTEYRKENEDGEKR